MKSSTILAASAAMMSAFTAHAVPFTLNPTIDAFVSSAHPTSNYGGAGALAVSASGLAKGEFDSVLQFNLSTAKMNFDTTFGTGQWVIDGISLQLTATSPNNAIFNASAAGQVSVKWMQNDSWTEGTGNPNTPTTTGITYSTLSSFQSVADASLGSFAFGGGTSGSTNWSLGLDPSLVADSTAGNLVSLLLLPGDSAVSMMDYSRTGATKPVLTIDAVAVPEPGTWGFAVCLVFAAIGMRRRHPVRAV